MNPLVSIIILCHNKVEFTKACIEQLLSVTPANLYELIIVDNNSSDETRQLLLDLRRKVSTPRINLLINNDNLGFVGGNNQAARIAKGKYILFLNNDTTPRKGWLEALIRVVEQDPSVGAVGAKLIYPDGRLQEAGGIIYSNATGCNYGKQHDPDLPQYNYVREVDYCSGACLLVRTVLFQKLGGFDTRFAPAYYEDTDMCFALRDMGHKVMYQHEAVVVHFEGATAGTDINSGAKQYQEVNRTKFIDKWRYVLQKHSPPPENRLELTKAAERIRGKKILFAHDIPQMFDRASGALRIHNLARLLKKNGHHVTYVCRCSSFHDGIDLTPYIKALQSMGVYVYPLDQFRNPNQAFMELLAINDFDAAFLPFYYSAQQFMPMIREMSPRTRIVIDSVDVHFLRVARQLILESFPGSWAEFTTEKNKELDIYRTADAVLTVTEIDKKELDKYLPSVPVIAVSDPHNSYADTPGFDDRRDIIFIAGFKHTPNVDATLYFYNNIWPLVQQRLPGVCWYIVGDSPPQQITNLATDNIVVTGYVPELEPYLHKAKVAVAPIRFGAGMKGKIASSLANGLPTVATSIASEGMNLLHGQDILVANTPREFVDAIELLYRDKHLWSAIAQAGKRVIDSKLGDEVLYPQFSKALKIDDIITPVAVDFADPVSVATHLSRANKMLLSGATDLAESLFKQVSDSHPEILAGRIGLALCQALKGNFNYADECLNLILADTSSTALQLTYAGIILDLKKDYGKALKAFLAAVKSNDNHRWILTKFTEFIKKLFASGSARELLSNTDMIEIDITSLLVKQADLCIEQNDIDGCLQLLTAASELAVIMGNLDVHSACKHRMQEIIDFRTNLNNAQTLLSQGYLDKAMHLLRIGVTAAENMNNKVAVGFLLQNINKLQSAIDTQPKKTNEKQENSASRKEIEIQNYKNVECVHDLPPIYHYWSGKYLVPKFQHAGLNSLNDFYLRYLRIACQQSNPYFISIGAGNCDFEVMLAKHLCDDGYDSYTFECIDINTAMLERGRVLAQSAGVGHLFKFSEFDVNSWQPKTGCSVIMANHSLHHFVELEILFEKIACAIGDKGVFLTNDMIGRNGHMRWPEALSMLHEIWSCMPERYKYNHQLKRHEQMYDNWDCSKESFEGIRAQDILPLLYNKFNFEFFLAFNSLIGVFIDRGFGHNFDTDNTEDLAFIDRIADIDEASIESGVLKPTQLIAAMRCGKIVESLKYHSIEPKHAIRMPSTANLPSESNTSPFEHNKRNPCKQNSGSVAVSKTHQVTQHQKNILIIASVLPLFDRDSGSFRLMQIIRIMRNAGHHVTFIARGAAASADPRPYIEKLRELGVNVHPVDPEKLYHFSGILLDVPNLDFSDILSARSYDIAYLYFHHVAAQYIGEIRQYSPCTRIIVDSVDLHFLREQREAALSSNSRIQERILNSKKEELATYAKADRIVTVTEDDKTELLKVAPQVTVSIIPNIHPIPEITPTFKNRQDLLFVGGFPHAPNVDAVLYFCTEIWPLIKKSLPDVKLFLVGNQPPATIQAMASERVIVTGYVPDTKPYLDRCRVSISPLRFGAGMKGKVGEALAAGLPVVASRIAVEGMGLTSGKNVLVGDDPYSFADEVIRVYEDELLWENISHQGKTFIQKNYSPEIVAGYFDKLISSVASEQPTSMATYIAGSKVLNDIVHNYTTANLQ